MLVCKLKGCGFKSRCSHLHWFYLLCFGNSATRFLYFCQKAFWVTTWRQNLFFFNHPFMSFISSLMDFWMSFLKPWPRFQLKSLMFFRLLSKGSIFVALRKIPQFHLISWYGNFVERHGFWIVSGHPPETMRKMYLSAKFPHQEIRWNKDTLRCVGWNINNYNHVFRAFSVLLRSDISYIFNIFYTFKKLTIFITVTKAFH